MEAASLGLAGTAVVLPGGPQGEASGYTRDGDGFIVTSESPLRSDPPVYLLKATSGCTSGASTLRC